MLLPQIRPDVKEHIATELKLDLKVLSASRNVQSDRPNDRITRLEAVCEFILEYGDVGTVEEPGDYFGGIETMRWGPLRHYGSNREAPFVFFACQTSRTMCCLGGATQHVIGGHGTAATSARSHTPYLLAHIAGELGLEVTRGDILGPEKERSRKQRANRQLIASLRRVSPAEGVWWAFAQMASGPEQTLEFLAKRLIQEPNPRPNVPSWMRDELPGAAWESDELLFGTPLYVALVE